MGEWESIFVLGGILIKLLLFAFSYPREPAQGPEFEKFIAPVDIVLYFECSNVSIL